jgi:hypothetical protein
VEPTTNTNPYDAAHQRERADWNRELTATGPRPCPRCNQPVYPDQLAHLNRDGRPFDLGHQVDVVNGGQGPKLPEHNCCNRSAGGKLAALRRRLKEGPRLSREW